MRELADSTRIEQFMRELGQAVQVDGRVYLTGGGTTSFRSRLHLKRSGGRR